MLRKKILLYMFLLTGISGFIPVAFAAQETRHADEEMVESYTPEDIEKLEQFVEFGGPDFTEAFFIVFNELNHTYPPQECMKRFARFDRFEVSDWDQFKQLFELLETEQRSGFLRALIMAEQEDFDAHVSKVPLLISMLQNVHKGKPNQKELKKKSEEQRKILEEFHEATTHSLVGKIGIIMLGFCQGYMNTMANTKGASEGNSAVHPEHIPWYARALSFAAPVIVHGSEVKYTAKKIIELLHQYSMSSKLPLKKRQEQLELMQFWVTEVGNVLWQHQGVDAWNMWSKDPLNFMRKYERTVDEMAVNAPMVPDALKMGISTVASTGLYTLAPAAYHYYRNKDVPRIDADGNLIQRSLQEDPHWKHAVCEMGFNLTQNVVLNPLWQKISASLGHKRMEQIEMYSLGLVSHDLIKFATTVLVKSALFNFGAAGDWMKSIADFTNQDTAYLKLYTGNLMVNGTPTKEIVRAGNIHEYLKFRCARFAIQQISTFCISQMLARNKSKIVGAVDKVGSVIGWGCEQILPDSWVKKAKNNLTMIKKLSGLALRAGWRMRTAYKFQQNSRGSQDQLMTDYAGILPESFLDKQADVAFAKKITHALFKAGFNQYNKTAVNRRVPMSVPWKRLIGWAALWYVYNSVESGRGMQDLVGDLMSAADNESDEDYAE